MRSRFGTVVERIACSAGNSWSRHEADEGRRCARSTPSHSDADAWLSRSTSSTRRRGDASAAARFTDVVVFPTPPLLLTTAITTWDLSVILSTNVMAGVSGRFSGTSVVCGAPVTQPPVPVSRQACGHASAASMGDKQGVQCGRQGNCTNSVGPVVLTDGSNANQTRQRARMRLLDWLKGRARPLEDSRLRGWRDAWSRAAAGSEHQPSERLAAELDGFGLPEDDVEVEREMLDALRERDELATAVRVTGLPHLETGHRVVRGEPCHYSAPASMPEETGQPSGRLLLTSHRAIFVGARRRGGTARSRMRPIVATSS
jgi:hypothetical protein